MSRYVTQWDDAAVASGVPTGWTRRWQAAVTPANALVNVAYKRLQVKRRAIAYQEVAANIPGAITYDAVDADASRANIEILTLVKVDQTTPATDFLLYTRGTGTTAGTENSYRAQLGFAGSGAANTISIAKTVAGAVTAIAAAALTFTSTKAYWVRFRVNGTALALTVWAEDQTEPAPQATAIDAAVAGVGFTGFQWAGSPNKIGYVNFLSVATNGDTAVKPRTDTEFNAWLDNQAADRRFLAEMSATGYNAGVSPFTKTVNVYIATGGYTTQPWDTPPSRHYDAWIQAVPNFRRQMPVALTGRATASFGSLVVSKPATDSTARAGVRDSWLRMKWKRNFVKLYLGDVSWPKHDFRLILLGRLGTPTDDTKSALITFPISDLLDMLDQPLQTNRYGSGAAVPNSLKPILSGFVAWMEPVPTTVAGLEVQWHDGAIFSDPDVYANGLSYTSSPRSASAVNAGTSTISTATPHGGAVDSRAIWQISAPGGLAAGTEYYIIAAGLTNTDFRVSATRGGAAMALTGTLGGSFVIKSWWSDLTSGKSTLTVAPAGPVMGRQVVRANTATDCYIGKVIDYLVTTRYGMAADYKDSDSFATADATGAFGGIVFYDEKVSALDALDRFCRGTDMWYGFTPDGLLQVGQIDLPAATSVLDLTMSDVQGLKRESVMLPINIGTLAVWYEKRFTRNGPLTNLPPNLPVNGNELLTAYTNVVPASTWGAAAIPLDDHPDQADVSDYPTLDSYFPLSGVTPTEADRLMTLFKRPIGIFSFQTRFSAMRDTVTIGSTISLTHPREGWKIWTAGDPASSDNAVTIDSTKAVVIGIDVNPASKGPFPVKLTVMRAIPGYYPTGDLN